MIFCAYLSPMPGRDFKSSAEALFKSNDFETSPLFVVALEAADLALLFAADPAFDRCNQGKLAKATGSTEEDALAIVENFREASFLTSPDREHTCDWESGHQA